MGENEEYKTHADVVSDLYFWKSANDPPLTYRMKRSEDRLDMMEQEKRIADTKKDTKMNLILAGIISLIAGLVLAHFKII